MQDELALAVAQGALRLDDKACVLRAKALFFNAKLAVVSEMDFMMDDPAVLAENQQIESVVRGIGQICRLTLWFVKLESPTNFIARGVGAKDDHFIP